MSTGSHLRVTSGSHGKLSLRVATVLVVRLRSGCWFGLEVRFRVSDFSPNPLTIPASLPLPFDSSAIRIAACRRSVLLPIPGSPEIKTKDPGTIPPPKTLSNSENPVDRRKLCSFLTSASLTKFPSICIPLILCLSDSAETSVSTSEFHDPHSGHLPRYEEDLYPHC